LLCPPARKMIDRIYASYVRNESVIFSKNFFGTD
jgi:hypothetical protein